MRRNINLEAKHKRTISNKEDGVFLKEIYEVDTILTTKLYYDQLFRMSGQLME